MSVSDSPPPNVVRAQDIDDRVRFDIENAWAAKLDAADAARTPTAVDTLLCGYCGGDGYCRCVEGWRADARAQGDEWWDA